jgi:hypothetical protein
MAENMTFRDKLVKLSGLSDGILLKSKKNANFLAIQDALALIHAGKGVLYGDYVKTRSEEPENFALLSLFFDIKRKYVRFENMAKMIASGEKLSHDEIIDTLSDLAVYGVMGLMLMDYFEGEEND